MIIYCNSIPLSKQVNSIGKYIYKHFDGAFRYKTSSNMCDVYIMVLYQLVGEEDEVHEMTLDLNITTYQDKLRIYIIELDKYEKTVGYITYKSNKFIDLNQFEKLVESDVRRKLEKYYQDYEFLF